MPHLLRLDLRENAIAELAPLAGCPHLTMLDLSFNRLSRLSQLEALAPLGRLQQLQLAGNDIQSQPGCAGCLCAQLYVLVRMCVRCQSTMQGGA